MTIEILMNLDQQAIFDYFNEITRNIICLCSFRSPIVTSKVVAVKVHKMCLIKTNNLGYGRQYVVTGEPRKQIQIMMGERPYMTGSKSSYLLIFAKSLLLLVKN